MKTWWKSKTLWLNFVATLIAIVQAVQGQPWVPAEYQVLVLAVLNAVLRFLTNQPIGTPPEGS